MSKTVDIIECPRDAMQGWKHFIPAGKKVEYLQSLLDVGFHTIDFGSFVSPKAIPQLADTKDVLRALDLSKTKSSLLAIVANTRGAEEAVQFDEISYLGFPFSISPTFQMRNTNSTLEESIGRVEEIQNLCVKNKKQLVVYLSMGFGNPYGDPYNEEILLQWAEVLVQKQIPIISLADTVGVATAEQVSFATKTLIEKYPQTTIGVHLHASVVNWREKLKAAVDAGCTRIDGALKGIGGCPMAGDELVGNMNTENILIYLQQENKAPKINTAALEKSLRLAGEIFI